MYSGQSCRHSANESFDTFHRIQLGIQGTGIGQQRRTKLTGQNLSLALPLTPRQTRDKASAAIDTTIRETLYSRPSELHCKLHHFLSLGRMGSIHRIFSFCAASAAPKTLLYTLPLLLCCAPLAVDSVDCSECPDTSSADCIFIPESPDDQSVCFSFGPGGVCAQSPQIFQCGTESSLTSPPTAAPSIPIPTCPDCEEGFGPCKFITSDETIVCTLYSSATGKCLQGLDFIDCLALTNEPTMEPTRMPSTTPIPSTTPSTIVTSMVPGFTTCTGCNFGSTGDCMHKPTGWCLSSFEGSCITTTEKCSDFQLARSCDNCTFESSGNCIFEDSGYCVDPVGVNGELVCPQPSVQCVTGEDTECAHEGCLDSAGPCKHIPSGYCIPYMQGTQQCFQGLENCKATTSTTTGTTSTTTPGSHEEYFLQVLTGKINGVPGLGFSTAYSNRTAKGGHVLFVLKNAPRSTCEAVCLEIPTCVGIQEYKPGINTKCNGLDDLGEAVETTVISTSWIRQFVSSTTQTATSITESTVSSTTMSSTSLTRTTRTETTTTYTTLSSTTQSSTTVSTLSSSTLTTLSTTSMTSTLPPVFGYHLMYSSSGANYGARFSRAYDKQAWVFSVTDEESLDAVLVACKERCSLADECLGVYAWQYGTNAEDADLEVGAKTTFICVGLSDIGGDPKVSHAISMSILRERQCRNCIYYSGPCIHEGSGFCMESIPHQNACIANFTRCDEHI